jgi:protein-S-isoprenylcysteine O-methyltransferase Ste14
MTQQKAGPGVRIPPPLIYLAGLAAGFALDRWWLPMPIVDASRETWIHLHAFAFGLVAVWLLASSLRSFRQNRNDPRPWREDTALVEDSIYRHTRNPMYLGMALAYATVALMFNALWPLLLLVPVLIVIRWYVIAREERYLAQRFGADYLDYCSRVRRWF